MLKDEIPNTKPSFIAPLTAIESYDGWRLLDAKANVIADSMENGKDMGEGDARRIVECVNNYDSLLNERGMLRVRNQELVQSLKEMLQRFEDILFTEDATEVEGDDTVIHIAKALIKENSNQQS